MLTLKVLAALLVYPEQELVDSLDEMVALFEAEGALPKAERRALAGFIADLCGADLMDAQARYVALFDHSRSLSLIFTSTATANRAIAAKPWSTC